MPGWLAQQSLVKPDENDHVGELTHMEQSLFSVSINSGGLGYTIRAFSQDNMTTVNIT